MFERVNQFMLISVCASIHHFLDRWSKGPNGTNNIGEPTYRAVEPVEIEGIFLSKMRLFDQQSVERRERLLQIITKQVLKGIDDTLDTSIRGLDTDVSTFANTLDGLDSDNDDNQDDTTQLELPFSSPLLNKQAQQDVRATRSVYGLGSPLPSTDSALTMPGRRPDCASESEQESRSPTEHASNNEGDQLTMQVQDSQVLHAESQTEYDGLEGAPEINDLPVDPLPAPIQAKKRLNSSHSRKRSQSQHETQQSSLPSKKGKTTPAERKSQQRSVAGVRRGTRANRSESQDESQPQRLLIGGDDVGEISSQGTALISSSPII